MTISETDDSLKLVAALSTTCRRPVKTCSKQSQLDSGRGSVPIIWISFLRCAFSLRSYMLNPDGKHDTCTVTPWSSLSRLRSSIRYLSTLTRDCLTYRNVLHMMNNRRHLPPKGLSTPGNKLLPETATLSQHLYVKVAVSGNNLLPFPATKLPFPATICCRFRQLCCLVWTGLNCLTSLFLVAGLLFWHHRY